LCLNCRSISKFCRKNSGINLSPAGGSIVCIPTFTYFARGGRILGGLERRETALSRDLFTLSFCGALSVILFLATSTSPLTMKLWQWWKIF
jgi:hypothetical protein